MMRPTSSHGAASVVGPSINVRKLTKLAMAAGGEKDISSIIIGGVVKEWVGIGWIELRDATNEDRARIPQAVYDDGSPA